MSDGWLLTDATRNRVRAEAQRATRDGKPLMGIVSSYDPTQYAAKVVLMPEGAFPEDAGNRLETDWIPISTHWSGDGWGIFMPPGPGDQVHVKFIDDGVGSAVIDGRVFDLSHKPLPVPSGEFWLVHQTGAYSKFTNDGKVSHHSSVQASVGNLTESLFTLVHQAFQAAYNSHTHGGGGPPSPQMGAQHLTTILKAN